MTKTGKGEQKGCKKEKLTCLLPLRKALPSAMKLMAGPRVLVILSCERSNRSALPHRPAQRSDDLFQPHTDTLVRAWNVLINNYKSPYFSFTAPWEMIIKRNWQYEQFLTAFLVFISYPVWSLIRREIGNKFYCRFHNHTYRCSQPSPYIGN